GYPPGYRPPQALRGLRPRQIGAFPGAAGESPAPSPAPMRGSSFLGASSAMHIWVDADACPLVIKEILYRAAERLEIPLTLVANKLLGVPRSSWIRSIQV